MKQWTNDDLTLFYYDEMPPQQRQALTAQLTDNETLRLEYAELCEWLDSAVAIEVPPPSEQLNQRIMAGIYQQAAQNQAKQTVKTANSNSNIHRFGFLSNWSWGRLAGTALPLVLVVLGTFYLGRLSVDAEQPTAALLPEAAPVHGETNTTAPGRRVLLSNLSLHLQSTDRLFTQVSNGGAGMAAQIEGRHEAIDDMLALNRIYRRMFEANNDKQLAEVLQQMEQVLLSLKHTSTSPNSQDWDNLRKRIDSNDLLFRLRVTNRAVLEQSI
ncbi:MAG: hypothetical protein HRT35_37370 [Algicola sp.]|nr:hypothetical protein [Algicola sp.]